MSAANTFAGFSQDSFLAEGWDSFLDKADQPSNPFADDGKHGKEKSVTATRKKHKTQC